MLSLRVNVPVQCELALGNCCWTGEEEEEKVISSWFLVHPHHSSSNTSEIRKSDLPVLLVFGVSPHQVPGV